MLATRLTRDRLPLPDSTHLYCHRLLLVYFCQKETIPRERLVLLTLLTNFRKMLNVQRRRYKRERRTVEELPQCMHGPLSNLLFPRTDGNTRITKQQKQQPTLLIYKTLSHSLVFLYPSSGTKQGVSWLLQAIRLSLRDASWLR